MGHKQRPISNLSTVGEGHYPPLGQSYEGVDPFRNSWKLQRTPPHADKMNNSFGGFSVAVKSQVVGETTPKSNSDPMAIVRVQEPLVAPDVSTSQSGKPMHAISLTLPQEKGNRNGIAQDRREEFSEMRQLTLNMNVATVLTSRMGKGNKGIRWMSLGQFERFR